MRLLYEANNLIGLIGSTQITVPAPPNDDRFHYLAWTYDGTAQGIYVDGLSVGSGAVPTATTTGSAGAFADNSGAGVFQGTVDETRLATVARSADWIAAEYNNQSSPLTFYTVGPVLNLNP